MPTGIRGQLLTKDNIEPYLDSLKADHNGKGYKEIAEYVRANLSARAICQLAGKKPSTRGSIERWRRLIREKLAA